MPSYQTISHSLFEQRSKEAMDKTPTRKEFNLKNIEVVNDKTLSINGKQVEMTKDAFKGLCKTVGLPVGFDKTFSQAFGDKARQQLVNKLKIASQAKGNSSVSVVINPESRKIIGVQKEVKDLISNKTFLDTTSSIINKYGLEVNDFSVSDNGAIAINASSPGNVWGLPGLKNEEFFGGISFNNSVNGGFQVSPYLHRLVCANGMIGKSFEESMHLGHMDSMSMEKFWKGLNELADRRFMPASFEEKVRLSMNTFASLAELENASIDLKTYSDAQSNELEAWVPLYKTRMRYQAAGIDPHNLAANQKKGAKTGTTVWDLVNGITHFASHDNGFKIEDYDRRKLQVNASNLLTKNFDMANFIKSPF
jgi:hypothetical protein